MADKNAGQLAREKQAKANKAAGVKRKAADESRQKEGQRNRDLAKKRQPYKNFGTTKKTLEERYTPEEIAKMNMKKNPKPVQGAGNMPLDDKQAAQQVDFLESKNKEKEMKGMKKMNMGGMTAPMMGDIKSKKPMMPPKRKPAPRPIVDPMAKAPDPRMKDPRAKRGAMPMMQAGGDVPAYKAGKKVRGYGKARGGKACKMR